MLGEYSNEQGVAIEEHLAACNACEDTIAAFDDTADLLVRHLPLTPHADLTQEPERSVWLQRLRQYPPQEREPKTPSIPDSPASPISATDGLGNYELRGILGRGGMGVVYHGQHRQLNRAVAIKVVSPRLISTAHVHERFEREIQILGGMNHPGIVMATDAGRIGPSAFLVMELVDGQNLNELVRLSGPLRVEQATEISRQIAEALAAAHQAGAIHRDIKPSNVMLSRSGRAKLLDFGLAHLSEQATNHHETSMGRVLGTLDYMAPEQADGRTASPSTDLYGLGATLFFLLTGQPPHGNDAERTLLQQLRSLANDEPRSVTDVRADVPPELGDLVSRLTSREMDRRPETADSVAKELATWADETSLQPVLKQIPELPDDRELEADSIDRSLLELLGTEERKGPVGSVPPVPQTAGSWNGAGTLRNLIALAAMAAAIYFGVTILVDTPEGTLQIQSDVADVQVELLDENDRTQKIAISNGINETKLRAGKYQISILGEHDSLKLDRDTIELAKGEKEIATIQMLEKEKSTDPRALAIKNQIRQSQERLGQSKPNQSIPQRAMDGDKSIEQAVSTDAPPSIVEFEIQKAEIKYLKKLVEKAREERKNTPVPSIVERGNVKKKNTEPIFKGEPLSVWESRFQRETDPANKITAAEALLSLQSSREFDTDSEIDTHIARTELMATILKVGGKTMASAFGEKTHERVFSIVSRGQFPPPAWGEYELDEQWIGFRDTLVKHLATLPKEFATMALCHAAASKNINEATVACLLLSDDYIGLGRNEECSGLILDNLEVATPQLEASAFFIKSRFSFNANSECVQKFRDEFRAAGEKLLKNGVDETNREFARAWINDAIQSRPQVRRYGASGFSPNKRPFNINGELTAKLLLELISVAEYEGTAYFASSGTAWNEGRPYNASAASNIRKATSPAFENFADACNRWLEDHSGERTEESGSIIRALKYVLRKRTDSDKWPTDQIASTLTKYLKTYYDPESEPITTATPHDLLLCIILCGKDIPEFVKAMPPQLDSVSDGLEKFKLALNSGSSNEYERHFGANQENIESLTQFAPFHTIRLILNVDISTRKRIGQPPMSLIRDASGISNGKQAFGSSPPVDPLLLLQIASESESGVPGPAFRWLLAQEKKDFTDHLKEALASPFVSSKFTRSALSRIHQNVTGQGSADLKKWLEKFAPELAF